MVKIYIVFTELDRIYKLRDWNDFHNIYIKHHIYRRDVPLLCYINDIILIKPTIY